MAGTLLSIAEEFGRALGTLRPALDSPSAFKGLALRLGWELEDIPPPVQALVGPLSVLESALAPFIAEAELTQNDAAQLLDALPRAVEAIVALSSASFDTSLPAGFGDDFPQRLLEFLVTEYMMRWHPTLGFGARAFGVVQERYVARSGVRPGYIRREIAWPDVASLLEQPTRLLQNAYGWNTANFDALSLLRAIADMLAGLGLHATLEPMAEQVAERIEGAGPIPGRPLRLQLNAPWVIDHTESGPLELGVRVLPLPAAGAHLPGLALLPHALGQFGERYPLREDLFFELTSDHDLLRGVALRLRPGEPIDVLTGFNVGASSRETGTLSARFESIDPTLAPRVLLGSEAGTRFEVTNISGVVTFGLDGGGTPDLGLELEARAARFVLAASEGDGFLRTLLPSEGIATNADVAIGWSRSRGLYFRGSAELELTLPVAASLGPIKLDTLRLAVATSQGGVSVGWGLSIGASIGPVTARVEDVGLSATFSFPGQGGNLGPIHLDLGFKSPSGVGLRLESPLVSGGGFLSCEPALGRYTGALHVAIANTIDLAAFGVLESGKAGHHWSLVIVLAGHFRPIELGWGFRLTGLGGVLALHRSMNSDALRDAAYGINGSLDDLLFPDSPETRLPQLLSSIERFFPPATSRHVAGPMAEIEWGRGKQVNARIRAALLFQLSEDRIALYGTVRVGFPRIDSDSTLRIRAGIEARFDFREQSARFSLSIIEATLFQSIQLTGGAAFFLRWGQSREFAFTIGGFHPAFRPYIPKGLLEPPRLGVRWKPLSDVCLDLSTYLAVTTTSMQFGAAATAEVGCSWGKVAGELAFDVLVMTSPLLRLEADLHARVKVNLFGADLLSAGLDGSLTGPSPWVFSGRVTWKVWIFSISKSFSFEWGSRMSIPAVPRSAGELLAAELQSLANWTSHRTRVPPIRIRSGVVTPLAPRDELEVRQNVLPFDTKVEMFDDHPLSDAGVWGLTFTLSRGIVKLADLGEVFPERRFLASPSRERPFRGGLTCGARLGRLDWDVPRATAIDASATEDVILDGDAVVGGAVALSSPGLTEGLTTALPMAARKRIFTRNASRLERVL